MQWNSTCFLQVVSVASRFDWVPSNVEDVIITITPLSCFEFKKRMKMKMATLLLGSWSGKIVLADINVVLLRLPKGIVKGLNIQTKL